MHSFRRHLDRDIAEAQIVIEHFLLSHAFETQSGCLQNAGSLDGDGVAHPTPVEKGNLALPSWHAINLSYSPFVRQP